VSETPPVQPPADSEVCLSAGGENTRTGAGARCRIEDALHDLARSVSAATGESFFPSLVEYLAHALRADCAFIAELAEGSRSEVHTNAVCLDGSIVPNIEYDLSGTPCSGVVTTGVCAYTHDVQRLFPQDTLLADLGIEGYAGTPLLDSEGSPLGLLVVMFRRPFQEDLPVVESTLKVFAARAAAELERQRAGAAREQALAAWRASEEHFKSAFERSTIGMAIIDLEDRFVRVNPALCELLGYSAEELTQRTTVSVSHTDDVVRLRKTGDRTRRLMAGEIPSFQVEKRYRHKQGHYFWALVGISAVRDADGNLLHYISQVQDITERKQAEEALRASEEALRRANEELEARVRERTAELESERALLEAVVRQMPAGLFIAEAPSGRLLHSSPQFARMLRVPPEAVSGGIEDLSRLTTWRPDGRPYRPEELNIVRSLRHGETAENEEMIVLRGDGTRGTLLASSAPIRDDSGKIVAAVGTALDITERKQTEEALRRLHDELETQVEERTAELAQANGALQEEVRERRRAEQISRGQTQALAYTLNALTSQLDLDTFFGHLMRAISEQLKADGIGVNQYDPALDRVIVQLAFVENQPLSATEMNEWGVAPSVPASVEATWQAVLRERRPFIIDDVVNDPRMVYREQFLKAGARSVLVVPLLLGAEPTGYFVIYRKRSQRYAPEEIELAMALGHQATLALQLARLAERGQEAAVLQERNRLAREIHDTLAQGFAGVLIHLKLAEAALTRKPEKALPAISQAHDLAKDSLAEARRSVLALRPNALENESLPDALRRQVDVVTAGTPIRPRMEVLGAPCPLGADTEHHLLRIGQEALNNVVKYAQATEVDVTLTFEESRVTLLVRDNGVGFTPGDRPRGGGFGHIAMRERVDSLRGELRVRSAPGQGTEIFVAVPVICGTGEGL
jgi:PAS domain S-box-containing protein